MNPLVYADASALAKLVIEEAESEALAKYLDGRDVVSSELVLTEIARAVRRLRIRGSHTARLIARGREVCESVGLRPISFHTLTGAGAFDEPALRTLDAIHLATALELFPLTAFVTYDKRQADVAKLAGMEVVAPGAAQ